MRLKAPRRSAMDERQANSSRRGWWRFPLVALVIALAAFAASMTVVLVLAKLVLPQGLAPLDYQIAVGLAGAAVAFALGKVLVPRLAESGRDDLPLAGAARWLLVGILAAAVLMSVVVALVALLGGYRIAGWGEMRSWAELLLLAGVQAAVVEEVVFRGVIFRFLEDFAGSWLAMAATSALFGLAHLGNANATAFSALAIAVEAGVLLSAAYMYTRSLWLPIGLHFGWNVTEGFIWDVPVSGGQVDGVVDAHAQGPALISGGAFGVEASVVALVVAGGVGAWLAWRAAKAGEAVRPRWLRRPAAA
jgi:membrane protease YdiL (CAAX protease family)